MLTNTDCWKCYVFNIDRPHTLWHRSMSKDWGMFGRLHSFSDAILPVAPISKISSRGGVGGLGGGGGK